jgi:hypothetical protein
LRNMSIADSPDCLFRAEDKTLQMLFPSIEQTNNFDEFLNDGLYASAQQDESSQSPENYAAREPHATDYPRLPSLGSTILERSPPQIWRKGLWCLNQTPPTKLSVEKTRKAEGGGTISTSHLLHNNNFAVRNHKSPEVSPSLTTTKRFATNPCAAKYRHKVHEPTQIVRDATLSPSPMYAHLPLQSKMEQVEMWQQGFQNFHLQAPHHSSSTPPNSPSKVPQRDAARYNNTNMVAQNAGIGVAIPHYHGLAMGSGLPVNYASRQGFLGPGGAPIWATKSLHSSNSSHQSYETMPPSHHSGHSAQSSLDRLQTQMLKYWSPAINPATSHWDSQTPDVYHSIAAPAPQRLTATRTIRDFDHLGGLGTQYPELEQMEDAVLEDEPQYFRRVASNPTKAHSPSRRIHGDVPPVPPLPFPGSHAFQNLSPFTTPRKQRRSPSRSPSPPLSPTAMTPRSLRVRSPTRTDHGHSHHRRKSVHKSGPIKDNGENVSSTSGRARSRSSSKAPRTPKTPKTPNGGFAIDFVNFTSKDSTKLLSDVAPSGSSKTRARREAEAREKRKKFSEAALKAVTSGDVEALKKAIEQ